MKFNNIESICKYMSTLSNKIFLLYGDVGAGKTTLIKKFLQNDEIHSPTYVHHYILNHCKIVHIDCYLKPYIDDMMIDYYITQGYRIFIEWSTNLLCEYNPIYIFISAKYQYTIIDPNMIIFISYTLNIIHGLI